MIINAVVKGRILQRKLRPVSVRKVAFCTLKGNLSHYGRLQAVMTLFIILLLNNIRKLTHF